MSPPCDNHSVGSSSPVSASVPYARYTLIDVNRAEANQPIELLCYGRWCSNLQIEKYDVLIISGARVEKMDVDSSLVQQEPVECEYRMVVDDRSDSASIIVYNWRDRILARPGKLHTAITIRSNNNTTLQTAQ
jgi:hypothetical protein